MHDPDSHPTLTKANISLAEQVTTLTDKLNFSESECAASRRRDEAFQTNRDDDHLRYQSLVGQLNTLMTELVNAKSAVADELPQRASLESRLRQMNAVEADEAAARGGLKTLRRSSIVTIIIIRIYIYIAS